MLTDEYDDCWLRYDRVGDAELRSSYRTRCAHVFASTEGPELGVAREELRMGLEGLLGREPHLWMHPPRTVDGFLAVGRRERMAVIRAAVDEAEIESLHDEGYILRSVEWEDKDCLVVTGSTDKGMLYGTYHLLRHLAAHRPVDDLDIVEEPRTEERIVNHWDNPFRASVERGYAGMSIFDWERLPDIRPRYRDYARLLASVGVNGIVLNNVNTQKPDRPGANEAIAGKEGWQLLRSKNLEKVEALATVFRRHGVRTYLSVNYAAPILAGDLDTADPLDAAVEAWWADTVDEVYKHVPDFGGFLVKADSEGQPGPYDYDRNHAAGANVLARALEPHGGRLYWRAFVYGSHEDRAVQSYETFEPLDGEFRDNVTVQIKNGPIDFQPREPVSTLFSAMPETNLACELQITQEYTGQGVHACYHVPQWKEVFEFDTRADGEGTPVKNLFMHDEGEGVAGVCNVGDDPNWTGHYLAQANLYGYGRLVWNPDLDTETITDEWVRQTFGNDPTVVETVAGVLHDSWPAVLDYTTGRLGLMHMMYNQGDVLENHYNPSPEEWPGYHGGAEDGIGVDRTASGSGYAGQFRDPVAERYESPETCPRELLLFFHHLPWEYDLDGTTVVQRLYDNCFEGVEAVRDMRDRWNELEDAIDEKRYRHVAERFDEQLDHAKLWRDTLVSFFHDHADVPDERGRVPPDDRAG
ncbi:alpha-glucuronidase family glycosyl hydrolase [Haladaptatus halobius]|uniref:alpha-glucuronidase family glycosyl hydrolase n=1 Tax=Haladaptatus halobius TaxID=2884875 RepID=UPI001D0A718A|nr:alpha-glucuronidase family glycosyl hydrolase [Haladaptatus halobius]